MDFASRLLIILILRWNLPIWAVETRGRPVRRYSLTSPMSQTMTRRRDNVLKNHRLWRNRFVFCQMKGTSESERNNKEVRISARAVDKWIWDEGRFINLGQWDFCRFCFIGESKLRVDRRLFGATFSDRRFLTSAQFIYVTFFDYYF